MLVVFQFAYLLILYVFLVSVLAVCFYLIIYIYRYAYTHDFLHGSEGSMVWRCPVRVSGCRCEGLRFRA